MMCSMKRMILFGISKSDRLENHNSEIMQKWKDNLIQSQEELMLEEGEINQLKELML